MTTLVHMNDQQYKSKLTGFISSSNTQKGNCQILIVEGIRQYMSSGRTTRLNDFFEQSVSVRSIPTVTIKDFIKSYTNLKYAKNKAGEYMFLKDSESNTVSSLPTELWYDWKKAKHNNVATVDYSKRLTNDVKKAIETGLDKQAIVNALIDGGLTTSDLLKLANTTHLSVAA